MLPMLGRGFILTLDMVFTPQLPMPDTVTSSYLFHAGLHYLNLVLPSDVLQKIMLLSILLFSAIGMHRLTQYLQPKGALWGIYAASIFFMINPFSYSRFMAGQYAVLLGYALLPWFVRLLLAFGRSPHLKTALKIGGLTAVIGVVSIHTLIALGLLVIIATTMALWRSRQHIGRYLCYGLIAAGLFSVASSYWLVPLAVGKGATSNMIGQFTIADTTAFATVGQNPVAKLGNIMRLQGFWAEGRNLYLLPQDRVVLWGLMALIIIGLVIWGEVALWRQHPAVVVLLAGSGLMSILLAAGLMEPLTRHVPLLAGYREPHKLVALVALSYSVLLAFGVNALLAKTMRRSVALYSAAGVFLLLLPLLFSRTMLFGFDGQLTPREYPSDWFKLDQQLRRDQDDFAVIFLPWHQYMSFQFAGRIIASPASDFFSKPTFVSLDPELGGATSGRETSYQKKLHRIIIAPDKIHFAEQLAAQNIKYLILAKDLDYKQYNYLNTNSKLTVVQDYSDITLYQNQTWRKL
jgi:hypothetical protein